MIRIKQVQPMEGLRVRLELTDGSELERDLAPLLVGPFFTRLRADPALFQQVHVVDGTLGWPGNIDTCPDMVIWGGPPPLEH